MWRITCACAMSFLALAGTPSFADIILPGEAAIYSEMEVVANTFSSFVDRFGPTSNTLSLSTSINSTTGAWAVTDSETYQSMPLNLSFSGTYDANTQTETYSGTASVGTFTFTMMGTSVFYADNPVHTFDIDNMITETDPGFWHWVGKKLKTIGSSIVSLFKSTPPPQVIVNQDFSGATITGPINKNITAPGPVTVTAPEGAGSNHVIVTTGLPEPSTLVTTSLIAVVFIGAGWYRRRK